MAAHSELTRDAVVTLYTRLLEGWNGRDAGAFAAPFTSSGSVVGFDGSQLDGREAIRSELARIFADHTMYQNTPARFDGRPQLAEQLTAELTNVQRTGRIVDAS